MIEFEKKTVLWKENVKLALQGAVLGACVLCIYLLFCLWGAV